MEINYYENFKELIEKYPDKSFFYATTKGKNIYTNIEFTTDSFIVFGKETKGLPDNILDNNWDKTIKIPMKKQSKRSLNLANSVNIILFEALRQLNFPYLE